MNEMRFSQSCENNRLPIIEQLKVHLKDKSAVLEIGSGTGQHAVYFAPDLPQLVWQTSDMAINHPSICAWLAESTATNIKPPLAFQLGLHNWPEDTFDAVYSANTAHIMQKHEVKLMMELIAVNLPKGGVFCQYGPFIEDGKFSSESNASFHQRLVAEGYGGYRKIAELKQWVESKGLTLQEKINMPANNLMLVWQKS
jgi:cyclopropane fatty-acyl-phospholipid synthase-like methyltransferase